MRLGLLDVHGSHNASLVWSGLVVKRFMRAETTDWPRCSSMWAALARRSPGGSFGEGAGRCGKRAQPGSDDESEP